MTQLNRIVGSSSKPLLAIAVCWGLAACEPSELRPVPLGLPFGASPAIPKAPATPATPMAPPVMAYTEDPEAETEEWEDYVWSDNLQQAQKKCQELAESSTEVPEVGQQFEHYGDTWTIAQVQTYQPVEQFETATEYFHIVICSWDGNVPPRSQWDGGASPLLVIHASPDGEFAVDTDSEVAWEMVMREEWISSQEGWQIQNLQHFEPIGERLPGDFDRVVVA